MEGKLQKSGGCLDDTFKSCKIFTSTLKTVAKLFPRGYLPATRPLYNILKKPEVVIATAMTAYGTDTHQSARQERSRVISKLLAQKFHQTVSKLTSSKEIFLVLCQVCSIPRLCQAAAVKRQGYGLLSLPTCKVVPQAI